MCQSDQIFLGILNPYPAAQTLFISGGIFLQNKTVACRDLLAMSALLLLSSQQDVTFFSHTKYGN